MSRQQPRISFEYFPPRTAEGQAKLLQETTPALNELDPAFFSVTYGAGGTTRDATQGVVSAIKAQGIDVAPHLSFGGDDATAINALIDYHKELEIINQNELQGLEWKFDSFRDGKEYLDMNKSYLYDLDIFGEGSVFQYLNRSATMSGESLLASFFINPELKKEKIEDKQLAISELTPLLDWRQEFQAHGRLI